MEKISKYKYCKLELDQIKGGNIPVYETETMESKRTNDSPPCIDFEYRYYTDNGDWKRTCTEVDCPQYSLGSGIFE